MTLVLCEGRIKVTISLVCMHVLEVIFCSKFTADKGHTRFESPQISMNFFLNISDFIGSFNNKFLHSKRMLLSWQSLLKSTKIEKILKTSWISSIFRVCKAKTGTLLAPTSNELFNTSLKNLRH